MDATTLRALTAMFLAACALLARSAHAAPLDKPPKPGKPDAAVTDKGKPPKPAQPHQAPGCSITGTEGADVISGSDADDVICGLGGNDRITGLGGNDTINGGAGSDTIDGGAGNDVLLAQDGARDVLDGGAGRDTASVDRRLDAVKRVERTS